MRALESKKLYTMCDGKKHDQKVSCNKSNECFYMIIMVYFEYFGSPWGRFHFRFVCILFKLDMDTK